jgi:hypothetical protein
MSDVFISYSHKNREVAERLAETLQRDNWSVFWDKKIPSGAEWDAMVKFELGIAKCVIVLWSSISQKSLWVNGEAAEAYARDTYLPFTIDGSPPPSLFDRKQSPSLQAWVDHDNAADEEIAALKSAVREKVEPLPMYGNLEPVNKEEPVEAKHLHLIHSCWRVDKESPYGVMPYQIHIILFGHETALKRVQQVEYYLPGYPSGHQRQISDRLDKLFELKELANGFSIVQANVQIIDQPRPYPGVLTLSRFINMTESGPRILDQYSRGLSLTR